MMSTVKLTSSFQGNDAADSDDDDKDDVDSQHRHAERNHGQSVLTGGVCCTTIVDTPASAHQV